jgi:hypothetical protein
VALFRVRPDGRDGSTLHKSTSPVIEAENETDSPIVSDAKPVYDKSKGGVVDDDTRLFKTSSSLFRSTSSWFRSSSSFFRSRSRLFRSDEKRELDAFPDPSWRLTKVGDEP